MPGFGAARSCQAAYFAIALVALSPAYSPSDQQQGKPDMRIAITGGLGRLGQYVVRALADHAPRVIDILAPATPPPDYHRADVRDLDALVAALQGIEVVVHLGAIDRSFATDDAATMQVNAMGTWNLFEASRRAGVRRVVHCSSSSATGLDASNPGMPPCYLPIDEAHPTHPTDAYGLSKLCGERIAEAFSRRGLQVLVIRPSFVAFPEMADFMAGKPGPEGRAEPMPYLRAYVGPEDCARGFAAAATVEYAGFEIFFLAAADVFATEPTVARLQALYGAEIPVRDAALYERFPRASPVSHAAAQARLRWVPTTHWPW
jgi:nucleoside-diphosphate-sugar epimerase